MIKMKFNKEAGGRINHLFHLPPAWNRNQYFTRTKIIFPPLHPYTAFVDHVSVLLWMGPPHTLWHIFISYLFIIGSYNKINS